MHIKKKDYRAMQDHIAKSEKTINEAFTIIKIKALHSEAQGLKIQDLEERIAHLEEENANLKTQMKSLADYYIDRVSDLEIECEQVRHDSLTA